tara:strand:+ start:446 stop:697 length:252 start_codon:yes stop_codon:yes gene_type:complete
MEHEDMEDQRYEQSPADELNQCMYEIFRNNPYGKKVWKHLRERLMFPLVGDERSVYMSGQHDLIRQLNYMIEIHRGKIGDNDE